MMQKFPHAPPLKDTAQRNVMAATNALSDHTGISLSAIGHTLIGDSTFVVRVHEGTNFTLSLYDRLMGGLSAIWPPDLAWPEDVPRPAPARLAPEMETLARKRLRVSMDRKRKKETKQEATADG